MGALNNPALGREFIDELMNENLPIVGYGLVDKGGQVVLISNVSENAAMPNLMTNPSTRDDFERVLDSKSLQMGGRIFLSC